MAKGGAAQPAPEAQAEDWLTVTGTAVSVEGELVLETDQGEVLVGLGPEWYRETQGMSIAVGDSVTVHGFFEDEEFKAASVENLTTGETLMLRDETGRPMWAGRGQGQGRGRGQGQGRRGTTL